MADIIDFDLVLDEGIKVDVGLDAGDAYNAVRAEAWAVGEKNGVPVTEGDPTWENNAKYYAGRASAEADRAEEANRDIDEMVHAAQESAEDAEAWAVGQRNGQDVPQGDETWNNSAKFYKDCAEQAAYGRGYMFFYIDHETGHLIYNATPEVNIDFELRNGRLYALWPAA